MIPVIHNWRNDYHDATPLKPGEVVRFICGDRIAFEVKPSEDGLGIEVRGIDYVHKLKAGPSLAVLPDCSNVVKIRLLDR